jgi:hypothetical protein
MKVKIKMYLIEVQWDGVVVNNSSILVTLYTSQLVFNLQWHKVRNKCHKNAFSRSRFVRLCIFLD